MRESGPELLTRCAEFSGVAMYADEIASDTASLRARFRSCGPSNRCAVRSQNGMSQAMKQAAGAD